MRNRIPIQAVAVALVLYVATAARADEPAKPAPLSEAVLVERLGDPRFSVRESATEELRRRGRTALAALEVGAQSDDPEVRRRCEYLLPLARRTDADLIFEAFVAGKELPPAQIPGWSEVRKFVSDNAEGRALYTSILRGDRPFLEKLSSDPKALAAEFAGRLERSIQRRTVGAAKVEPAPGGNACELAELLLIANTSAINVQATNRIFLLFMLPDAQAELRSSGGAIRLLERWFETKLGEPNTVQLILGVVRNCGCNDLIERRLKPDALRLVKEAAANPLDTGKFYQSLAYARQLQRPDLVEEFLKPAIRKTLEESVRKQPYDLNRILQLVYMAQAVGDMATELRGTLELVLVDALKTLDVNGRTEFPQLEALANFAGLKEIFRSGAAPKVRGELLKLATLDANPSFSDMWEIYRKALATGLDQDIDTILRPAWARLANRVAQTGSPANVREAVTVARLIQVKPADLEPVVRQAVERFCVEPRDLSQIGQALEFANVLTDRNQIIETTIRPAALKALKTVPAKDQPIDGNDYGAVSATLDLLQQLQLKEGIGYAIKALRNPDRFGINRVRALQVVGALASPADVAAIEPLLTDSSPFGMITLDGKMIQTQFGDVCLACLVWLTKQNPTDYGFPINSPFDKTALNCWGFENGEQRAAALKKWQAWRSQESKRP